MLERRPILRERVLGLTALGAIVVGGAVGVDTAITSGWQPGGSRDSAPVTYLASMQQYQDDVNRDWSTMPPQHVNYASADANASAATQTSEALEGTSAGTVTAASYTPLQPLTAPSDPAQTTPPTAPLATPTPEAQEQQMNARYDAIEAQIQQATASVDTPNDSQKPVDDQNADDGAWPPL